MKLCTLLYVSLGRIQALKKSVSKGDKKRKKEITTEIAQLEAEIQSRHESELNMHTSSAPSSSSTHDEETSVASVISSTNEMRLKEEEGEMQVQRKSKSQKKKVQSIVYMVPYYCNNVQ